MLNQRYVLTISLLTTAFVEKTWQNSKEAQTSCQQGRAREELVPHIRYKTSRDHTFCCWFSKDTNSKDGLEDLNSVIPLHLLLSCSWPYLTLRTFVGKRWSCLVNAKMCWRRYKELAQSLWSQDRAWISLPLESTLCFIHLNVCAHLIVMKCLCVVRWVGFERPGFAGDQFVLEKGEYPRWSTWTNCQSSYTLTSFRPLKVVSNH